MPLLRLSDIPYAARQAEAVARRGYPSRSEALTAARYEIVDAPGTYSSSFPKTLGWVLTESAAQAIAEERCKMPGGYSFRLWTYVTH